MELPEMRLELVELVLEHIQEQNKLHKYYHKFMLKMLENTGPKTAAELEPYKPKQYTLPEVLQLSKQLENYVLNGTA